MTHDLILALVAFAFVTSVTPGPNNLMLMASGATFGFRRTVPHMLGVGLGFTAMTALIGVGIAGLLTASPALALALKVVSFAYMLWFAWKILHAPAPGTSEPASRPMTFLQAAAFQWVNPKAWAMALTAVSAYAPDRSMGAVMLVSVIFGLINIPSVGSWTLLGQAMRGFLAGAARRRAFKATMAALLVLSLLPVLTH
ncbi:MAG: LysE family translocator [Amaricoccus sp.]